VQILARVGKPSPPGEGANVVSTTGEDSRTDSDLRPSPAVFIRRGPRPLPTTALPHRERASHERDRNENDCGHRKYCAVIVVVLVISGVSALGLGRLFLTFVLKARRPS